MDGVNAADFLTVFFKCEEGWVGQGLGRAGQGRVGNFAAASGFQMADDADEDGDRGGRAPGGRWGADAAAPLSCWPRGKYGISRQRPTDRTAERKKKDGAKGRKDTRGVSSLAEKF